jgi:hypothetical protein
MIDVDYDVEPAGETVSGHLQAHQRVRRVLMLLEAILAQWAAYDADHAQPATQRVGVECPRVLRESCLTFRERFLAELHHLEGAPLVPASV